MQEDAICRLLRSDVIGTVDEVKEQFDIKFMPNKRPLQITEYQRENYKVLDYSERSYFIIVDSNDADIHGVLLCNLEVEHGYPDAVLEMPDMAGMTAMSLGIANSNWPEVREGAWYEGRSPRIAIYDNQSADHGGKFRHFASAVDAGLHYKTRRRCNRPSMRKIC